RDEPAEPHATLGRSYQQDAPECAYSRTRESYQLEFRPSGGDSDPQTEMASRWHEQYDQCLQVLRWFQDRVPAEGRTGEAVQQRLLEWIKAHPLHQLC